MSVSVKNKRPLSLVAIVIYKGLATLLMMATSIALLLILKNHQTLILFSESYILEGKLQIIEWFLEKIINIKPQTLKFSGIVTGIYSCAIVHHIHHIWLGDFLL